MLVSSGACETGRDAQEGLQQVLVRVREAAALTRDVGHLLVDELQHAYNTTSRLNCIMIGMTSMLSVTLWKLLALSKAWPAA